VKFSGRKKKFGGGKFPSIPPNRMACLERKIVDNFDIVFNTLPNLFKLFAIV
jgi:hypothetical protein